MRNFFRFALVQELRTDDPTLNLESPKIRRSLPGYLRLEEVESLLAQPDDKNPRGCAIAPCSKCCTPPACAFPNWSACA